jgi:hypothetical protein
VGNAKKMKTKTKVYKMNALHVKFALKNVVLNEFY